MRPATATIDSAVRTVVAGVLYGSPDICSNVDPETLRDALASLPLFLASGEEREAPAAVCEDLGIPAGSPWRVARDAIVEALGLPGFPPIN